MSYEEIKIDAARELRPRFYFTIEGKKFDLPDLRDDISLIESVLLVESGQEASAAAVFVNYLRSNERGIWSALQKSSNPPAFLDGLIKQWTAHAKLDPKA